MKVIEPSYEILNRNMDYETLLAFVESIGRTCYKSSSDLTKETGEAFVKRIIKNGHESVLEHGHFSIRFICDRGISHELVRHRNTAYSQESTRYCNYGLDKFDNELTFIRPFFFDEKSNNYGIWKTAMQRVEDNYLEMIAFKVKPEEARSILPNSIKTEIVFTMNIRELRSFLKLRTDAAAHPQMRQLTIPLLKELKETYPAFFCDMEVEDDSSEKKPNSTSSRLHNPYRLSDNAFNR